MLAVERRAAHLYFFDVDDESFCSATVRYSEESEWFEVNIGVADLGMGQSPTSHTRLQLCTPPGR